MGHIVRTTFEAVPDIEGLDLSYDSQFYAVEIIRLTAAAALVQHKLTVIFSADVVGYSGLMERDEAGTLARLKANRKKKLETFESEGGKAPFDGVLGGECPSTDKV